MKKLKPKGIMHFPPIKNLPIGAIIALITAVIVAILVARASTNAEAATQIFADRIVVEVEGEGTPVLIIPGLTSSPEVFKSALTHHPHTSIHWITLAGFAGVPAPTDLDEFVTPAANAIVDYIKKNDLKQIKLVGHSMGGVLSLMIAAQLPERVDSILIIDSVPFLAALFQPGADPELVKNNKATMRAQISNMSNTAFIAMMRQGLPRQATSPAAQARVWADIERADQQAVAVATSELFTTDYRPILKNIDAELSVIIPHNAYIGVTPEQLRDRYKDQYNGIENAEFHVIENSRHFIMLDQPEALSAAFNAFMEGNVNE